MIEVFAEAGLGLLCLRMSQKQVSNIKKVLYFFSCKMEFSFVLFFSFQNNPKNLDPSYKMDLDLWDCLGRVKLIL